jgi:putative transcriptional regulator
MKKETIKEILREKALIERGEIAPARVTEILPDGKGGHTVRRLSPEAWRKRQATQHAARIAAARRGLRLTQGEFADLLGISRRTVENWEQGRCPPTGAARVLIEVAARNPKAVLEAVA